MCDSLQDKLVLKRILIITYTVACLFFLIIPVIMWPRAYSSRDKNYEAQANDTFLYMTPQSLDFIYSEMDRFAEARPDDVSTWMLEGNTSDHRKIKVMKIHVGQSPKNEKIIMVVAGMDPAAWFTATACLALIYGLLNDCHYTVPLLTEFSWLFVPVANPDGYEFIMNGVKINDPRLPAVWHKNRHNGDINSDCKGVHLDRNWPFHFQEHKLPEPLACNQEWGGPYPFSEMETNVIQKLIEKHRSRIGMFIYLSGNPNSARITYPWSFTLSKPYSSKPLEDWSRTASRRVRSQTTTDYLVMQRAHGEKMSGVMTDYVMGYLGVKHVFTVEARGDVLPIMGMDIAPIVNQLQVVLMTLGREYNKKGGACRNNPLGIVGVLTLALVSGLYNPFSLAEVVTLALLAGLYNPLSLAGVLTLTLAFCKV